MIALALLIGVLLPTLTGWCVLTALEGKTRVLLPLERWVMGAMMGMTLTMLLTFALHAGIGLPLNRSGFLILQSTSLLLAACAALWRGRGALAPHVSSTSLSRTTWILLTMVALWMSVKILLTSITFLLLTPTFLDDTLDNWNLRGKVFFVDQALTLVMPGEDPLTSPMGVSSYPPAVPLSKTWLATLAGEWSDPLVNSIHLLWYLGALALVFFAIRRRLSFAWACLGTYLIGSLPLYLMHGSNPYADAFVSVHVFLAASLAFFGVTEGDPKKRLTFLRLGALAAGLLTFTKNEGLLVYLPPILLLLCFSLWRTVRRGDMHKRDAIEVLGWYGGCLVLLGLPWLLFKWQHGLTFGNAKPFTSLGIGWQEGVAFAISINTFLEGNWLLLFPLLLLLLIAQWRRAFSSLLPLAGFFLIVYVGQGLLFFFTGLSTEALRQTGYARGLVHLTPTIVLLTTLLLEQAAPRFFTAWNVLAANKQLQSR